jgi:predicted dehydrogenase
MEPLRFGICGLGCMGRSHFARLQQQPAARVVAVCDADQRRRTGDWNDALGNMATVQTDRGQAPLADLHQYAEPRALIADPDVDAVLITLPTALHAEVAIAALEGGKHVLCEKPMAIRVGDCDRMLQAAERNGRTLMVAQCIRFWPQYELIKRYIDEGRLGRVRFMTLRRLGSPPTYSFHNWLLDATQSGGALLDLHVHDVDFAHHVFGVPETITARGTSGPSGGCDHVVALHGYPDGRYVHLEGGWALAAPWPFEMEIEVHGDAGTLGWAMSRGTDVLYYNGAPQVVPLPCAGDAIANEQAYFIDCTRSRRPVARCLPFSTRTSVALAWLEQRSIQLGRPVNVGERLRAAWSDTD